MSFGPTCESLEHLPVAALVRAAQDGQREAFDELFRRYERAVYAVIFQRLGNHAEAQELCQEVFIQALRKIATMKSIPYQTLIRQWLAEGIRKELHLKTRGVRS